MDIVLKSITSVAQFTAMSELESRVWGLSPIPLHQTITASKNGGIAIGAYDGEKLVGFSYGFAGFSAGETYLCSHMMGIDPDYRDKGIGNNLKQQQAEEARRLGYRKIRWTYDPLESRNGYLNLSKLGAICSQYIENCYGEMIDELNRGLPSDRFNVEWLIDSPHLESRLERFSTVMLDKKELLLNWRIDQKGLPEPLNADPDGRGPLRFVPIPANFRDVRKADAELALAWRMCTRQVFQASFADGWGAVWVLRTNEPVVYYVLSPRKGLELELGERK
jgi:predicted GNAT superfamily acetyltransferase